VGTPSVNKVTTSAQLMLLCMLIALLHHEKRKRQVAGRNRTGLVNAGLRTYVWSPAINQACMGTFLCTSLLCNVVLVIRRGQHSTARAIQHDAAQADAHAPKLDTMVCAGLR
jgi:ABC-type Fe3+ transport system permease subunit